MLTLVMMLAASSAGEDRSTPPRAASDETTWVTTEDYPEEAWRQGFVGVSHVRLAVDIHGTVSDCVVIKTSGTADLDTAACTALRARARFTPARDARGRAIAGTYTKRVRWQIPGRGYLAGFAPLHTIAEGVIVRIHMRADRSFGECNVLSVYGGAAEESDRAQQCERMPPMVNEALGQIVMPPEGMWLEFRQQFTAYRERPDWGAAGPAAGSDSVRPAVNGPAPLLPGHT